MHSLTILIHTNASYCKFLTCFKFFLITKLTPFHTQTVPSNSIHTEYNNEMKQTLYDNSLHLITHGPKTDNVND